MLMESAVPKKYDIIIVGSGGGSKITRPAANLGNKVAIIESGRLGGTCLNHGCIPSKMLIHPADVASIIDEAHRFELDGAGYQNVRFKDLVERVNAAVDAESDSIEPLYEAHPNVTYYPHHASFVSDKVLDVGSEELTAEKIFLAVGAKPHIPPIEGLEGTPYMTYKEALRNTEQPKRLIVIGGGYIAVELGYFMGALGTETHFLVRSCMLRHQDDDIIEAFRESFTQRFSVHYGAKPFKVDYDGDVFAVRYRLPDGREEIIDGDALLVCTGVKPCTDALGIENTPIELDDQGYIKVDDYLETASPGVFAMGDVIGRNLFRHTANYEGEYLFKNQVVAAMEGREAQPIHYPPIPHAVFTRPQIAGVGMKEKDLQAAGIDYVAGVNTYADSAMGMALRSEEGFAKVLFDRQTRKLLGAHIIGEEASNMIHMLIAYMKMGATCDDIMDTIFIHPALPEVLRNAVRKAYTAMQ